MNLTMKKSTVVLLLLVSLYNANPSWEEITFQSFILLGTISTPFIHNFLKMLLVHLITYPVPFLILFTVASDKIWYFNVLTSSQSYHDHKITPNQRLQKGNNKLHISGFLKVYPTIFICEFCRTVGRWCYLKLMASRRVKKQEEPSIGIGNLSSVWY